MSDMTPLQRRMTALFFGETEEQITARESEGGPSHLTAPERMLYNDGYTSSTEAERDPTCYICTDPDFARMGMPLCRTCPECQKNGRPGHIAADDNQCTVCGYIEDEEDFID